MGANTTRRDSPLTFPLKEGTRPFELSQAEAALSADDWAWLFLRRNPYYVHDYELCVGSPKTAWEELCEARPPGSTVLPATNELAKFIIRKKTASTKAAHTAPRLSEDVVSLDSRYFAIDKQPLTGRLDGLKYHPLSLKEYLANSADTTLLGKVTIREFDAARDFGVGTWLDPQNSTLPRLPERCSWFFHANAPIWQASTWALAYPKPIYHVLETGERIQVGSEGDVSEITELDEVFQRGVDPRSISKQLESNRPIPPIAGHEATKLQFLICLDGYVQPQVERVRPIAENLKNLHRRYFPKAVKRGAKVGCVATVVDPANCSPASIDSFDPLSHMRRDPSALKRHWRQIGIDVAGPLVEQFAQLTKELKAQQAALADQLAIPIRNREGRQGDGREHWLKKALAAVELHLSRGQKPLSQAMIARVFYDTSHPLYWAARGLSDQPSTTPRVLGDQKDGLHEARKAFETGSTMVLGWYEFVTALDRP